MKKNLDNDVALADFKKAIVDLQEREDQKNIYIIIGMMLALLLASVAGVVWLVKKKNYEDIYDEDWDSDWDQEDFNDDTNCDCCCNDSDVDKTVKVEKI